MRLTVRRLTASGTVVVLSALAGCSLLRPETPPERVATAQPSPTTTQATTRPSTQQALIDLGLNPSDAFLPLKSIPPKVEMPEPTEKDDRAVPPQAVKHYMAGRELYKKWMNAEAIAELEQALRYDPGSFECHLLLGRAAARSGNVGQARNHLREAARLRPDDVTCQYLLGTLALESKDVDEAMRRFRLALKSANADPDRAETVMARFRLGEVLLKKGYVSAAIEQLQAFEEAVADPSAQLWKNRDLLKLARTRRALPALLIGQGSLILHRYDQAVEAYRRALQYEPGNLKTRVRLAQALSRANKVDEALAIARKMALDPKLIKAGVELLGWIHRDRGRPGRVADELMALVRHNPDRDDLGVMLADALIDFDQTDRALKILRDLIAQKPEKMQAYVRLAGLYVDTGKIDQAVGVLADAIAAADGPSARVLRMIGKIGSDTDQALAVLNAAERLGETDPDSHAVPYIIGLVAHRADRPDEAERWFRRSLKRRSDFLPGYISLAQLHLNRFQWSEALEVIGKADEAHLEAPALTYLRAQAYDGLDDIAKAAHAYEQVIEVDAKSVQAMVALGRLHERIGQRNKARLAYARALKVAPAHPIAGERLVRLLLSQGDVKEASEQLREFRKSGGDPRAVGRCLAVIVSRGKMDQYRKLVQRLLNQNPRDVATLYDLATSYYSTRDYDEAEQQARKILEIKPGHQRARQLRAELARKRLDYDSAVKWYKGLLREHPNRGSWLVALAETYLDLQQFEKSAEIFEALLKGAGKAGRSAAYRLRLISIHAAAKQIDRAVEQARAWLEAEPGNRTARRMLIEALHEGGDHDQAIQLAEEWLASGGKDEASQAVERSGQFLHERRSLVITTYVAADRHQEALARLVAWLEEDPRNASLLRQLWLVLSDAKRLDEAIELCRNAIASSDEPQMYQLMLAQTLLDADQYDGVLETLDELGQAGQGELVSRLRIMTLLEAKRYDEAVQAAKRSAGRVQGDDARLAVSRLLVLVHQRRGHMDRACKELEQIYEMQPKDPGVNNDLGYTWADEGLHLEKAERMVRYALGEEPRSAAYMDSLGWVLYKKGDFEGAVHYLSKATRAQNGDDPVIYDHLGDAYWRLGKKDQAKASWKKAIDLAKKDLADGKDLSDPEMPDRTEKKLRELSRGAAPSVADVVGKDAASQPAKQAARASGQASAGR